MVITSIRHPTKKLVYIGKANLSVQLSGIKQYQSSIKWYQLGIIYQIQPVLKYIFQEKNLVRKCHNSGHDAVHTF